MSTCRAMEQIIIYWHNPGVNLLFCTWSCLRAALAALIWSRFCARTALLLSPKACSCSQLVFRKQTISACHRHTTDHCQSSLESAQTCHDVMAGFIMRARAFTSTSFYVCGSQVKVHPGARFSVSSLTKPIVSIDIDKSGGIMSVSVQRILRG